MRNGNDDVALLRRIAGLLTDKAEHLGGALLGEVDRFDQIGADVAFGIAAADREHQDAVVGVGPAAFRPRREYRVLAFVVGARNEFGDIVDRAIGFDAA